MAINFQIAKHATVGLSRLLATNGGKHIFDVKAGADRDEGSIIGLGDYVAPTYFSEADSTEFEGVIMDKAANGNWYILVKKATNALLVASVPLIYEEYSKRFTDESNFYNLKDELMRCPELAVGDIFEVSADGISGSITKGAKVVATNKKLTVTSA